MPNNTKEDKNISQMVTNLSTAINTIYHAYKEDKHTPVISSPDTRRIGNSKKSSPFEGRYISMLSTLSRAMRSLILRTMSLAIKILSVLKGTG